MGNVEIERLREKNSIQNLQGIQSVTSVQEPSDLKEALKELNNDTIDPVSRFSNIDMRSRVSSTEIPAMSKIHSLVTLNFLPEEALNITRSKLRLNVSLAGKGREEMIAIGQSKREEKSFFSGMGGK